MNKATLTLIIIKNLFKCVFMKTPIVNDRHHPLFNDNGSHHEILYCNDCDMAGHPHTLGINPCYLCGKEMQTYDAL